MDGFEIGEDELSRDYLDVAHRVDRAGDVMNVVVLETADDLDDRINFADVGEKFVAEALARARALDQPGDVDELEHGGNDFLGFRDG